jgi:hypothetical protein
MISALQTLKRGAGRIGATREKAGDDRRARSWDVWLHLLPEEGAAVDRHIREGRFQRSLALIAGLASALSGLEVLTEHYRGSYSQRVMYSPIIVSPALLIAGASAAFSRSAARWVLPIVSLLTIVDGTVGFVFHVRGVARKPGGWRVPVFNVIMGPPVFAPLLFALSGYLGLIATFLRREDDPPTSEASKPSAPKPAWAAWLPWRITRDVISTEQHIREGRFQKQLAVAAAISALFSGIEALYSHYKNNFRYKVQWTPILLTPPIIAAGIGAVFSKTVARTMLPLVSILALLDGAAGTFYHVRGMLRRPGGRKYPVYNLIYGPPVFAPLLFAASGFLGLLASLLRRAD